MSFIVNMNIFFFNHTSTHSWHFLMLMSYKYIHISLQMVLCSVCNSNNFCPNINIIKVNFYIKKKCVHIINETHTRKLIKSLTFHIHIQIGRHKYTFAQIHIRIHTNAPLIQCARSHNYKFNLLEKRIRQQVDRDEPFRICSFSFLLCVANRTE